MLSFVVIRERRVWWPDSSIVRWLIFGIERLASLYVGVGKTALTRRGAKAAPRPHIQNLSCIISQLRARNPAYGEARPRTCQQPGLRPGSALGTAGFGIVERLVEALDQPLVVKGLAQEAERASREHAAADLFLGECRHENHRRAIAVRDQAFLQIGAGHARHMHVGNQTRRIPRAVGAQILLGGRERRCVVTQGSNEAFGGLSN